MWTARTTLSTCLGWNSVACLTAYIHLKITCHCTTSLSCNHSLGNLWALHPWSWYFILIPTCVFLVGQLFYSRLFWSSTRPLPKKKPEVQAFGIPPIYKYKLSQSPLSLASESHDLDVQNRSFAIFIRSWNNLLGMGVIVSLPWWFHYGKNGIPQSIMTDEDISVNREQLSHFLLPTASQNTRGVKVMLWWWNPSIRYAVWDINFLPWYSDYQMIMLNHLFSCTFLHSLIFVLK